MCGVWVACERLIFSFCVGGRWFREICFFAQHGVFIESWRMILFVFHLFLHVHAVQEQWPHLVRPHLLMWAKDGGQLAA